MEHTNFYYPQQSAGYLWAYRYLKHPNYLVVMLEIATLPLAFGALKTAIIFSILNFGLLRVRIKVEEEGLKQIPAFEKYFI